MSKTNFRAIHDQTDLTQATPLDMQPSLGNRLVSLPDPDGRVIQEAAQTPGQTNQLRRAGDLPDNLAQVDRATFINADHQPNKVTDLWYPGLRLQFTNLPHPRFIAMVDRHWVTRI